MLVVNGTSKRHDSNQFGRGGDRFDEDRIFSLRHRSSRGTPLRFLSNVPVMEIDSSKFRFMNKDSVQVPLKFELAEERKRVFIHFRQRVQGRVSHGGRSRWHQRYLWDFKRFHAGKVQNGQAHQTIARCICPLENVKRYPVIVDLINDRGMVSWKGLCFRSAQEFEFRNLEPARFKVRLIYDDNENRKWDTGNFLESNFNLRKSIISKM